MGLKHKVETKIIVDEADFNDFVEEVYGQPYEFVADTEADTHGAGYEYNVKKGII